MEPNWKDYMKGFSGHKLRIKVRNKNTKYNKQKISPEDHTHKEKKLHWGGMKTFAIKPCTD